MDLGPVLRKIAAIPAVNDGVAMTVTLDLARMRTPPATRLFVRNGVLRPLARLGERKLARQVEKYVSEVRPEADGLYLTAASGGEYWHAFPMAVAAENSIHFGRRPCVAPLLELRDRHPRALVVRSEAEEFRLDEFQSGESRSLDQGAAIGFEEDIQRQDSMKGVKTRGSGKGITVRGGSDKDRWQRRRRDTAAAALRTAAERAAASHRAAPAAALFFFGTAPAFKLFRDALKGAEMTSTHEGSVPRREPELWRRVAGRLGELVDERTRLRVREFHDRWKQGRGVALGPQPVLQAVADGSAGRVFVEANEPLPGSCCAMCGGLFADGRGSCGFCSARAEPVSITDELARAALARRELDMTFVPAPSRWLRDLGGTAALLRRSFR